MPSVAKLHAAVGCERRRRAAEPRREPGFCLKLVELGGRLDDGVELGVRVPKRIRERREDATDFFLLAFGQRHDVVVELDRRERFEVQARAARRRAVHDAGNRVAMFGADDDDVAAVAIGDDLVLKVLGGVAAAGQALER